MIKSNIFIAFLFLFIFSSEKSGGKEKPAPHEPAPPVVVSDPEVKDGVLNVLEFKSVAKDDRQMMQMAVDHASNNEGIHTVFVPDGTYMIEVSEEEKDDSETSIDEKYGTSLTGVKIKSNLHFKMAENAVLKGVPNDAARYAILRTQTAQDVKISGGQIIGDRDEHLGTMGQWGHGIEIGQSKRIVIENVHLSKCWGDGIYIGGGENNFDITVKNVISDNNRRQGMSVTHVDGLEVSNSTFSNTGGSKPEAGMDLEPNPGNIVTNVHIINCVFENNAGAGLELYAMDQISNVLAESCTMTSNEYGINVGQPYKHMDRSKTAGITFRDIEITGKTKTGIILRKGVKDIKFKNVNVTDYIERGVHSERSSHDIELSDCTFKTDSPEATGMDLHNTRGLSISNCEVQGGKHGALLDNVLTSTLKQITFSDLSDHAVRLNHSQKNIIKEITVNSVGRNNIELFNSSSNTIINSSFTGGGFLENGKYSFMVFSEESSGNTISNNTIQAGPGSKQARYGILFESGTDENTASDNQIDPGTYTEKAILDEGNNTIEGSQQ